MKCPYCGCTQTTVLNSRKSQNGFIIRRRRVCTKCKRRFTTVEKIAFYDFVVIKKNGEKEPFSKEKIKRGILKATFKRPINVYEVDHIVEQVIEKIKNKKNREIKTWEIGNIVLNLLKKKDKLAYLLFASIYRDFKDLDDFIKEIETIKKKEKYEK